MSHGLSSQEVLFEGTLSLEASICITLGLRSPLSRFVQLNECLLLLLVIDLLGVLYLSIDSLTTAVCSIRITLSFDFELLKVFVVGMQVDQVLGVSKVLLAKADVGYLEDSLIRQVLRDL